MTRYTLRGDFGDILQTSGVIASATQPKERYEPQIVKYVRAISPDIYRTIFPQALIVKTIHL